MCSVQSLLINGKVQQSLSRASWKQSYLDLVVPTHYKLYFPWRDLAKHRKVLNWLVEHLGPLSTLRNIEKNLDYW